MLIAVFLAVGASVVVAQDCWSRTIDNCTLPSCQLTSSYCRRQSNVTSCSTEFKTCSGDQCASGSTIRNVKSCSRCADQCPNYATAEACIGTSLCEWAPPICVIPSIPAPPLPHCYGVTTQAACTAMENCLWLSASYTVCGGVLSPHRCIACNATFGPNSIQRSALRNYIGKTCTWNKEGGYDSDFVMSIKSVEQNVGCGPWFAPNMGDVAALTELVHDGFPSSQLIASATTLPTCVQDLTPGQTCSDLPPENCTATSLPGGCQLTASSCSRVTTITIPCSTESKTCSGDECKLGATIQNYTTCSKCTDSCSRHTTEASCIDAEGHVCRWNPSTCTQLPPTPVVHCVDKTTQSACTAVENCWWLATSYTTCGEAFGTQGRCSPCNGTGSVTTTRRSAVRSFIGKTCTWDREGKHDSDFVLSVKSVEQHTACAAFLPAGINAVSTLSQFVYDGYLGIHQPIASATIVPTCVQVEGNIGSAAALLPNLALLVFVLSW